MKIAVFFSRLSLCLMLLTVATMAKAQSDTLVRIHGLVKNVQTSEPVKASIIYEKMPYGDDMGIAISSAEQGAYQMYMIKHGSYKIKVKAEGYIDHEQEVEIKEVAEDGTVALDFSLKPTRENEIIRLENLLFARSSARIQPSSFDELNNLVDLLKERPKMVIQLEGHTDFEGNANANYELSLNRVEAVKKYLTTRGIKKKRILLKAYGGQQPLSRDRTDEAKKLNRRVEVRVIKK